MLISSKSLSKEEAKTVNKLVGEPFPLLKRVTSNKILSRSLSVDQLSPKIFNLLGSREFKVKAIIEIRPQGILISVSNISSQCIWVIPYYQFYIYDRKVMSIHAQGNFVHFKKDENLTKNMYFFKYLYSKKLEYNSKHPHIDSI